MLVMIEVSGSVNQTNGGSSEVAAAGFVDVRQNTWDKGLPLNLVRLMEKARPLSEAAASGKTPSLYESLPINVRAALNKEQPTAAVVKTASVAKCKKFWHPNTKTHNLLQVKVTPVSVPRANV